MRTRGFSIGLFVALFALGGCSTQVTPTVEEGVAPEDKTTHLGDKIDVSLVDWLKLPRAELAKLGEEWTLTVSKQFEAARSNVEAAQLLPQLRPPVVAVGFAEAKFSPAAGFSLPPYLKEGQKDAAVALHLARMGDQEAARKLADPADKDLAVKIGTSRGEHNYPIEWTRLVALVQQSAELKLANGEPEGAAELVSLHRQLRSLLDAKTALAAALLPRGRQSLSLAAAAWREPRWNKTALAADIDAALADWGELSEPINGFQHSENRKPKTENWFVQSPLEVQRALDLLALPLSSEGADGVAAFLDDKQNLTELLIVYRPKLSELFPEPPQLALPLLERGYKSEANATASHGLKRQSWTGGGATYEVTMLTRGNVGGAVVRVCAANRQRQLPGGNTNPAADAAGSPWRDFGAVHFDRSFEQNRLNVARNQSGASLEIKDAGKLAGIKQPVTNHALAEAVLQRETNADLLAKMTLHWPADQNRNALTQLALPLWAAYGPAGVEGVEEAGGGSYALTWQSQTTRLKLNMPFEDKAPELLVDDNRGSAALKARVQNVAEFDRRERQERLAAGKSHQRLRRFVQLPSHGIDDLQLGMTRKQVYTILPRAQSLRAQPLADGLNILVLNESPTRGNGEPVQRYWPRQLFVRFGADDRVKEIRVRYQEWPQRSGGQAKLPGLLDALQAKPNGAPESLPPTWAAIWTDLPARKQPVLYRWRDDVTCVTYQHDSGGSEVVLRDCSHESELPLLQFCGRGVEACVLGDSQAAVHKRWRISNPIVAPNGAEIQTMPANSPYDVLLVWYENDKVARLIARHRQPKAMRGEEVGAALHHAWGADLDHLGFIRRQDGALGQVLQSYGFHDDRTRVRLFAQETEEGIRLFTEWREWPIVARTLASK